MRTILLAVLLAVPVHATELRLECPQSVPMESFFHATLVATTTQPLGAYSTVVTYDPTRVSATNISGGDAPFAGNPVTGALVGKLALASFQNATLNGPTGTMKLADIGFTSNGMGGAILLAFVKTVLFDTGGNAIVPVTAIGCMVEITAGPVPPTTTTTTLRHGHGQHKGNR